jgi:hypothetical protein
LSPARRQPGHTTPALRAPHLDQVVRKQIRNHYLGAPAKGTTDNHGHRFAVNLTLPFTSYADISLPTG